MKTPGPVRPDVFSLRFTFYVSHSRRVRRRLGELLLFRGGGRDRFEVEVLVALAFVLDGDADQVFALERAAENVLGERVFDVVLDRATQRTGAEVGAVALVHQELFG